MSTETEAGIPAEARNFKAPTEGEETKEGARKPGAVRSREEWVSTFAEQDRGILETTLGILERRLAIPDSKDNSLLPEARQEGVMKVELIRAELDRRNKLE